MNDVSINIFFAICFAVSALIGYFASMLVILVITLLSLWDIFQHLLRPSGDWMDRVAYKFVLTVEIFSLAIIWLTAVWLRRKQIPEIFRVAVSSGLNFLKSPAFVSKPFLQMLKYYLFR